MPLTSEQLGSLNAYLDITGRTMEPVFAGREDLFRLVYDNARATARGSLGCTICLSGPPGIGKSAFRTKLMERNKNMENGFLCVGITADRLRDPQHVLAEVVRELPDRYAPDKDARHYIRSMLPTKVRVGIPGITGEWERAESRFTADDDASFPWQAMAALLVNLAEDGKAVALLVDDAQYAAMTPNSNRINLLSQLHGGPPYAAGVVRVPVFAVLEGHSQTTDLLDETISKGRYEEGNEKPMKRLTDGESREYVLGTLDHVGFAGADAQRQEIAAWIVGECGGWPLHLASAMKCVAREARRADSMRLSDLDGERIAADLSAKRVEYYASRLGMELAGARRLVNDLLERMEHSGMSPTEDGVVHLAHAVLAERDALCAASTPGKVLPMPIPAAWSRSDEPHRAFFESLRDRGVLARCDPRDDRLWICPIASMRDFIRHDRHAARAPWPDLSKGDVAVQRPER